MSIDTTLVLLDSLTPLRIKKRQLRGFDLLAAPGLRPNQSQWPQRWPHWCAGWAFAIHPAMATALDIQLKPRVVEKKSTLEWTQGSAFDFREGYTIHDAPEAWNLPWGEALKHIGYSLKIVDAIPASPANATRDEARFSGEVTFQIYRPNADCTVLQTHGEPRTVSQDDFVRLLIVGLPEEWTQEQPEAGGVDQTVTGAPPKIVWAPAVVKRTYNIDAVKFYTRPIPQVHIVGAFFGFTGKFKYGFQEDVIQATHAAGGRYLRGIADYLVVGERLSKNQDFPLLSNQVKDALMYREVYGANIAIVPESAWLAGMQNPTPLPESAKEHYPHNDGEENTIWEGKKHIRLQYQKYDSEHIHDYEVMLMAISVRLGNQAIYLWGLKKDNSKTVMRANCICSDILDVETGESFSVDEFLDSLLEYDFKTKPYTQEPSGEFVPLVEIGLNGVKEV